MIGQVNERLVKGRNYVTRRWSVARSTVAIGRMFVGMECGPKSEYLTPKMDQKLSIDPSKWTNN